MNEKYPGGVPAHKEKLEAEGHEIIQRGQKFAVADYERYLVNSGRDGLMSVGDDTGRAAGAALPDLVLASTSVYRRALLERLGVPFRWQAPLCDEESYQRAGMEPRTLAESSGAGEGDQSGRV